MITRSKIIKMNMTRLKIYIVCDFQLCQSKHWTSQCNGWRLTCCGRSRKHRIEIPISKSIFNLFVSHNEEKILLRRINVLMIQVIQNIRCNSVAMIFVINNNYPSIKMVEIKNGLKMNFEIEASIQCFRRGSL